MTVPELARKAKSSENRVRRALRSGRLVGKKIEIQPWRDRHLPRASIWHIEPAEAQRWLETLSH